jgi:flagellar motor switch/type III secretory pathway protein FliN
VLIGGEPAVIALDQHSARTIAQEIAPVGDRSRTSNELLEYLVQRFLACLGMCQAGMDLAPVAFCGRCVPTEVEISASVRFSLSVNASPVVIMIGLGLKAIESMDGLWRRQVHSSNRSPLGGGSLRVELAQLGVPPQMLSEYLSTGTIIDLEVPVSDAVTLRLGHKPFVPARLAVVDGVLGCQVVQGSLSNLAVPEGTSRLSIEIGSVSVDAARLTELGQVGSVLMLNAAPSDSVSLVINQERVGSARLCLYQGRFAVEVL